MFVVNADVKSKIAHSSVSTEWKFFPVIQEAWKEEVKRAYWKYIHKKNGDKKSQEELTNVTQTSERLNQKSISK